LAERGALAAGALSDNQGRDLLAVVQQPQDILTDRGSRRNKQQLQQG
jgi:hypothetical protein